MLCCCETRQAREYVPEQTFQCYGQRWAVTLRVIPVASGDVIAEVAEKFSIEPEVVAAHVRDERRVRLEHDARRASSMVDDGSYWTLAMVGSSEN